MEPNANVNLTRAASFNEFVNEIRRERRSHVLFMPQYAEPWKHRIFQQALEVLRDYPEFPQGSRRWDDRVFYPDREGVGRPLAQLWPNGQAPMSLRLAVEAVRLMGHETRELGSALCVERERAAIRSGRKRGFVRSFVARKGGLHSV